MSSNNETTIPAIGRYGQRTIRWRDLDGLDRKAMVGLALLTLWFGCLVATLDTTPFRQNKAVAIPVEGVAVTPEYAAKIKIAKQLLAAGNMEKLGPLLEELIAANPYQAEPFMLMGDYHLRRQEAVPAMHAYRQALDLNLDYLEKKSPLYQGKKIRNIATEAEGEIRRGLAADPKNQGLKAAREEFHYLLRKLAGGCGD
ncbi:MAG: hypothetical protein LC633_03625 [Desulfobulbaceae bacterium]|nr:hypothetical protein [Desulfobulbaceae bacterium]